MDSGDSSPSPAHVLDVCCFLAVSRSSTISGWFSRIAQSSAVSPAYVRVCMWRVGGWGAGGEEGAGVGEGVGAGEELGRGVCGEVKRAPLRTPSLMLRLAPALTSDSAQDGCCE